MPCICVGMLDEWGTPKVAWVCSKLPIVPSYPYDPHRSQHYRGNLLMTSSSPPQDHHRPLGIVPLQGPGRGVFLMREVTPYMYNRSIDGPGTT